MVLVTGGTGFIGSHLVEKLARSGVPVRCLVRRKAEFPAGVETAKADLATSDGLEAALAGVDTVVHLAGVTKALRPADYYAGNTRASENLARVVARRAIRFVHVSSLAAAGPSPDGTPLREDAEPHPVSDYGKSKLEAERVVRELVPSAVIIRPPVVYGPRDTGVYQILKGISRGLVVEISGGERWFSAIFIGDLVDGLLAAARVPKAVGRTYYLAYLKPVSWSDLRTIGGRIMARDPRVLRVPAPLASMVGLSAEMWAGICRKPGILSRDKIREAKCRWWVCDPRRAAADLGFQAATPPDAGLAITLAWYKEAGWLKY